MARDDLWPRYCRSLLAASVASAAREFPGRGEMAPERVHGLRKTLKQARALARLFGAVGEPARVTIASLAVARRRVAGARDLDVIEARLDRIAAPDGVAVPLRAAIARARAEASRGHTTFATRATRAQLDSIARRLESLDIGGLTNHDIAAAVERTYRQGLRRGRRAFVSDDAAALHALRARVVDLRYQLAALAPAWPAALHAQSDELNALRDTLGEFNDLEVFAAFVVGRGGLDAEAQEAVAADVRRKQGKMRRRAQEEFDRLFADSSRAFGRRLAVWLNDPMEKPRLGADRKAADPKASPPPGDDGAVTA